MTDKTKDMIPRTEAEAMVAAARAEMLPWARLGWAVMKNWPGDAGIDAFDLQDMAEEAGVLVEVPGGFDPDVHRDPWDCAEPGDPWCKRIAVPAAIREMGDEG